MKIIKKITSIFILICLFAGVKCFATSGIVNAPNGLVLREKASKTANPITTISDKQKVEIIEKEEEWYKVKYNSYEGYLFAEYVTAQEEPSTEQTQQDSMAGVVVSEENSNQVTTNEQSTEQQNQIPAETMEKQNLYPKETVTLVNAKVYLVPSITASVTNNIEASKTVTINKVLNAWAYVTVDSISGWVRNSVLKNDETTNTTTSQEPVTEETKPEEEKETTFEAKQGYINASSSANVRETANKTAKIITTLTTNTGVTIVGEEGTWYKITYGEYTGYISKELISDKPVAQTTSRGDIRVIEENTNNTVNTVSTSGTGEKLASFAKQYLGKSYVSGGTTPDGFDCSGFVYYVCNSCGYNLSRNCQTQASSGTAVSKAELQQGDLVFFNNTSNGSIGHVGMYIGDGRFIHAANANRGVTTDTLNSGYYNTYYYSARRIAD